MKPYRREIQVTAELDAQLTVLKQIHNLTTDSSTIIRAIKVASVDYLQMKKEITQNNELIEELQNQVSELSTFVHTFHMMFEKADQLVAKIPLSNLTQY